MQWREMVRGWKRRNAGYDEEEKGSPSCSPPEERPGLGGPRDAEDQRGVLGCGSGGSPLSGDLNLSRGPRGQDYFHNPKMALSLSFPQEVYNRFAHRLCDM